MTIGTPLWDPDETANWVGIKREEAISKFSIHNADDFEEKWNAMGLDDHLKIGRIAGIIGPFRCGASAYLEDPCLAAADTDNSPRLCLQVRTVVEEKKLDVPTAQKKLEIVCHRSIFTERKASHVVERIVSGLDIYCVFQQQQLSGAAVNYDNDRIDRNELTGEEIKEFVEKFRDWLQSKEQAIEECPQISVTLFTDWDGQTQPRTLTYAEAYNACYEWLDDAANNTLTESSVIPLTVWLRPLTEIPSTRAKIMNYHPISSQTMAKCLDVFRRMSQIDCDLRQILIVINHQKDQKRSSLLERFELALTQFGRLYRARLAEHVQGLRAGTSAINVSERSLIDAVDTVHQSVFSPYRLGDWVAGMKFQIDMIERLKGILPEVPFHEDVTSLEMITQSSYEPVLALKLPHHLAAAGLEPLLDEMSSYVRDHLKLSSRPCGIEIVRELPEMLNQRRYELVSSANQFAKFIDENKFSKMANYQVSIDVSRDASCFHLYSNRDVVAKHFKLPSPPIGLNVAKNSLSKITLEWSNAAANSNQKLTGFLVEYRCVDEARWSQLKTRSASAPLFVVMDDLTQENDYYFRVAALTAAGRSAFSKQIGPETVSRVCDPPENISCDYVTDNMIKIRWTDPAQLGRGLKITSYKLKFWSDFEDESSAEIREIRQTFYRMNHLQRGTAYRIQLAAICGSEGCSPFSRTVRIETLERAERIALIVREVSSLADGSPDPSTTSSGLAIYDIPLRIIDIQQQNSEQLRSGMIRKIFGFPNLKFKRKTILVVGATGSGKTTLINAMINHILNVEWADDFRFQLIQEPKLTQAKSQTDDVTAYDLFHVNGSRVDFSLTIVDTPGFGDTRGLERDSQIFEQIHQYFQDPRGIQEVDAICFVVQAALPRLTPTQQYIFDSILSIFGKDIRDNIRLMTTFSDGQTPAVLAAVQDPDAKIPYPRDSNGQPLYHKFNNSCYFADKGENDRMDSLNASFYSIGEDSFQRFFQDLHRMKTTSLSLTKEVLEERKKLEVVVEGLHERVNAGLVKMEELKQMQKALSEHKEKMAANEDFQFEVEYVVSEQKDISGTGHYITNCQNCKWTCHYPCKHLRDQDRVKCYAMDPQGNCMICPGRCSYKDHFHQKFKWEQVTKKVQKSSEAVRKNYQTAQSESATCEEILKKMSEELADFEKQLLELVKTTYPLIQRLDEIALRPHPFSAPDYIDLIIASEKQERRPGYETRIENLKKLRQMAEILSKLINKENVFETSNASSST